MAQVLETPEQASIADGATASFPISFTFTARSEIEVVTVDPETGARDVQVLDVDYEIPAGDWATSGGSVVFLTGHLPVDDARVERRRVTPASQAVPFGDDATFRPVANEGAFDKLTRIAQEARAVARRGVVSPVGEAGPVLQPQAVRDGKVAWFDGAAIAAFPLEAGHVMAADPSTGDLISLDPDFAVDLDALSFPTRLAAELTSVAESADFLRTAGYAAPGDGGAALFARVEDEPAHAGKLQTADGAWFENIEPILRPEMFATLADLADDMAPALLAAAGLDRPIRGRKAGDYQLSSFFNLDTLDGLDFDLGGATIRIVGDTPGIARYSDPAISRTVTDGGVAGTAFVEVASTAGLAVGDWVQVSAEAYPLTEAGGFPYHWTQIRALPGAGVVLLEDALPVTYFGVITLSVWGANLKDKVRLVNGTFDGTGSTYDDTGSALWLSGYRQVDLDIELTGFEGPQSPVLVINSVENNSRVRARGYVLESFVLNIQQCRAGRAIGCDLSGYGFGIGITRCGTAMAFKNVLCGRRAAEIADSLGLLSVRGIKVTGNAVAMVGRNDVSDYESPIRGEAAHNIQIIANHVRDTYGATDTVAVNVSSQVAMGEDDSPLGRACIIALNSIERCAGVGISVQGELTMQVSIKDNQVRQTGAGGIYCTAPNADITGNRIRDWDLAAVGHRGLHYGEGATVRGNRFSATDVAKVCMAKNFVSGGVYSVGENVAETGNPLFPSNEKLINSGTATIAAGATSETFNHGLAVAPVIGEVTAMVGGASDSPPGAVWATVPNATQLTLHCAANPGASGLSVHWRAAKAEVFTA